MHVAQVDAISLGGLVIWLESIRGIRAQNQPDTAIPHDRPFSKTQQSQSSPALAFGYNAKVPENNHRVNQTVLSVRMCHHYREVVKPWYHIRYPKVVVTWK
jgi:hypothetical protein